MQRAAVDNDGSDTAVDGYGSMRSFADYDERGETAVCREVVPIRVTPHLGDWILPSCGAVSLFGG